MSKVLVIAELHGGEVRKATHSAITAARQICEGGGSFRILVVGSDAKTAAQELKDFGAEQVIVCQDPSLQNYVAETFAPAVAAAAKDCDVLLATATSYGKDLMPRVAGKLDAGYASDCSAVVTQGGALKFRRPMFAGNAYAHCEITEGTVVATLRQSEFEPAEPSGGESPVVDLALPAAGGAAARVEFVSLDQVESERPELTEARVVVSGGRALKEKFFDVIEPLADQLGAAIGASRAACDAGYAPGDFQVGQTGKVVAPDLYIAIGISGAIQHIAGMKGSKTIVAINKDPEAPIFQIADYGLVQDLFQAVPELVESLRSGG